MEEGKKLYIKMLQKTMEEDLDLLAEHVEQQYSYIEKMCNKLVLLWDKDINKNIECFFNDLEKLEKDFKDQYVKCSDIKNIENFFNNIKEYENYFKEQYKKYLDIKNIECFFNDLEKLEKDFRKYDLEKLEEEFKKQYTTYLNAMADMCKEMYEEIKKL